MDIGSTSVIGGEYSVSFQEAIESTLVVDEVLVMSGGG